jgi:hypothetical protein
VVTPAGKSSREVSRRSHSDFSIPRICEQSGLLAVAPTPRDAGGTVSACVATRVRFVLAVSLSVVAALAVLGRIVCCDVGLEAGVSFADEAGVGFDDSDAGVGWDGVAEGVALGGAVAGDGDVAG